MPELIESQPPSPRRARPLVTNERKTEREIAGEKVRILRNRQRLSLTKLAATLRINRSTLKAIEDGSSEPLVFDAYAIAKFFGLPMDMLFLSCQGLPPLAGPNAAALPTEGENP